MHTHWMHNTHTHKLKVPLQVKSGCSQSHTHTWTLRHTAVAFEWMLLGGIMTAFCSNHSWDSSHRRDRQRERKTISLCLHLSSYSPPPLQQPWLCPEHVTLQRSTLLTGKVWTDESFNAIGDYGRIKEIFLQKHLWVPNHFHFKVWKLAPKILTC